LDSLIRESRFMGAPIKETCAEHAMKKALQAFFNESPVGFTQGARELALREIPSTLGKNKWPARAPAM
jgi:hypothetical protein